MNRSAELQAFVDSVRDAIGSGDPSAGTESLGRRIFGALGSKGFNIELVISSPGKRNRANIAFALKEKDVEAAISVLNEMKDNLQFDSISSRTDIAIITPMCPRHVIDGRHHVVGWIKIDPAEMLMRTISAGVFAEYGWPEMVDGLAKHKVKLKKEFDLVGNLEVWQRSGHRVYK